MPSVYYKIKCPYCGLEEKIEFWASEKGETKVFKCPTKIGCGSYYFIEIKWEPTAIVYKLEKQSPIVVDREYGSSIF